MLSLICIFFPAVLSVWMIEKLSRKELSPKDWFYHFVSNTVWINMICFLVKKVVLGTASATRFGLLDDIDASTALNYLIIALAAAVIVTFASLLLPKWIRFSVEDDANEDC